MKILAGTVAVLVTLIKHVASFDVNCNSNYVSYYGQNSARNQKSLGEYCKDATEDLIVLAFMNGFPNILLNFANACETTFDGSSLLHCPNMAKDIKYCQSQGKAVVISMGGASGAYGFGSESDGTQFADTVWNMFLKGNSSQRPFDDAVLDGIDLDIEGGGGTGYVSFIEQLRSHYNSDTSKKYYIAAAPQCPYPDAYLGSTLNSAWFDMVYVQFYNNYCGLNAYPNWFNFEDWDNWAKKDSINKDVKVYIGAPGSPSAASSGYVDGSTLTSIYNAVRSKYSSLGGIMTWDVSQARTSGIANSIRSALDDGGTCRKPGGGGEPTTSTTQTTSTSISTSTSTSTDESGASTSSQSSSAETTSSNEPTTTSLPANCPVSGAHCSGNEQGCNGQNYAICNQGSWYVAPCNPGTSCYLNGNNAMCDWANGRATDTCAVSSGGSLTKRLDFNMVSRITKPNLLPNPGKAKSNIPTRIEFIVSDIAENNYTAVVKIQADKSAFSGDWEFTYNLPVGQTVDSTSRGTATTKSDVVTIKSNPTEEQAQNMAAIFKITGSFTDDYILPDTNTTTFYSA